MLAIAISRPRVGFASDDGNQEDFGGESVSYSEESVPWHGRRGDHQLLV